MLPHDPTGKVGPKTPYPDIVEIREPKEEEPYVEAIAAPAVVAAPVVEQAA
jgi:small subunit ribosomal protein S3e